ncbi:MAG: hypothetical protein IKE43_06070 [Coriobacteriales bacterium]|nr:hypothetical protein [Coriobacteriales bacterium]
MDKRVKAHPLQWNKDGQRRLVEAIDEYKREYHKKEHGKKHDKKDYRESFAKEINAALIELDPGRNKGFKKDALAHLKSHPENAELCHLQAIEKVMGCKGFTVAYIILGEEYKNLSNAKLNIEAHEKRIAVIDGCIASVAMLLSLNTEEILNILLHIRLSIENSKSKLLDSDSCTGALIEIKEESTLITKLYHIVFESIDPDNSSCISVEMLKEYLNNAIQSLV